MEEAQEMVLRRCPYARKTSRSQFANVGGQKGKNELFYITSSGVTRIVYFPVTLILREFLKVWTGRDMKDRYLMLVFF